MKSNQRWTRAGIGVMVAALAVLVPAGIGAVSAGAAAPDVIHAATVTTPPWEPDNNAVFGGIDFYNASGQQITGGSITDAPLAAYAVAEHTSTGATLATLFGFLPKNGQNNPVGSGFVDSFQGDQLSDSTVFPNGSAAAGVAVLSNPVVSGLSTDETLQALMTSRPNTDTTADGFAGMYQLRVKLSSPAGTVAGYASTDIQITGNAWAQVYGSFTSPVSGGSGATTTSTAVTGASPVSPTTTGTPVTFTATVTPSTAVGAVQFMDNGSALGSAVTVSGGTATSVATSALPAGTHSITAVFTPTSAASFTASTSSAISYVVNAAGATATTTTVAASPPSPTTAGTSVTFTATVAPNTAAGSVQFKDGSSNLGSAVTVTSGTAALTTATLPQATHSITAVFTPTTPTAFNASTSNALSYVVNASLTAVATTTALAVSPATTAATGAAVQLTATVACSATCTPAGTVTFWDGGSVQIGATQTVVSGSATVSTTTLSIGSSHSFVAIFTPTDLTAFAASQSAAVPYSITSTDTGSATLIDSVGTALGANPTLTPGQSVTVQAGGFTAGETVSATVHSVPEALTPATATSTGAVAYSFTVPTDLAAGAHSLVLAGATSSHTVTVNFSIAAPTSTITQPTTTASGGSLPFTGSNVQLLAWIAVIFLGVGMGIRFSARAPQYASGAHARRGPGAHARTGAKHSRR